MSVLRSERPSNAPASVGPRAKALRPFEVCDATRSALYGFEHAAKDYEEMRLGAALDLADARFLRTAASTLLAELRHEHRAGNLPRALDADLERWIEGEFEGSDVDVEIANHAIYALLGSDVCAELMSAH